MPSGTSRVANVIHRSAMAPSDLVNQVPSVTDTQAATISTSRLSVNGVPARRAKAEKLSGALAAHTSSNVFKGSVDPGKPKAKRWDHILSLESRSRTGSRLKEMAKHLANPGLISLCGGLPASEYFPFESLDFKVPRPPNFTDDQMRETGQVLHAGKYDYRDDKSLYDIHIAFNYGQSVGSAQLLRFITEHTEMMHDPPYQDWCCALTVGSTSAFDMALRMFCERGDMILSEEYMFVSAVDTCTPLGIDVVGVAMDDEGIRADALDEVVTNWDEKARGAKKPHVLYIVPSGQNPTGTTQTVERRRAIYAVCKKHDLYILEDEPYYYLQMAPYVADPNATPPPQPRTHNEFIHSLVASYLSMDVDGRVFRMDSFSKVIAPGSRVGWITASEQIIQRYTLHGGVSQQSPSGVSQLMLYKLLDEGWGHSGYLDWLAHIRREYSGRRDVIVRAAEKFLPCDISSWKPPMAGMFFWVRVDWRKHPKAAKDALTNGVNGTVNGDSATAHGLTPEKAKMLEIEEQIFQASIARGVLTAKGSWFRAERDHGTEMFVRMTFAAAPADDITEAIRRFGEALRSCFSPGQQG